METFKQGQKTKTTNIFGETIQLKDTLISKSVHRITEITGTQHQFCVIFVYLLVVLLLLCFSFCCCLLLYLFLLVILIAIRSSTVSVRDQSPDRY